MNKVITLTYSTLYDTVERSLSIIGKRATDDKGNRLFKDITLGTNEKTIAYDYFREAALDVATALSMAITASSSNETSFTFTITLHNPAVEAAVQKAIENYAVAHTLYSWFTVTAPSIAKRYLDDRNNCTGTILALVYNRAAPAPPESGPILNYADIEPDVMNPIFGISSTCAIISVYDILTFAQNGHRVTIMGAGLRTPLALMNEDQDTLSDSECGNTTEKVTFGGIQTSVADRLPYTFSDSDIEVLKHKENAEYLVLPSDMTIYLIQTP